MAQVWAAKILQAGGYNPGVPADPDYNASGSMLLSCTGPASSVSAGAVVSITSDVASKIFGAKIIAKKSGASALYEHEVIVSTGFGTAQFKLRTWRRSTGALLSSNTNLSSQTLYLQTIEQPD